MTGFGCFYCDFPVSEHDVALSCSLTHGKRASAPTAASVLARSYRKRYQKTDPSVRDIPHSAFWQRGGKDKISEGHCLLCEVDIAPYTKDNLIQHLCQDHPPIIVDVDSAALSDRHARPPLSKLPIEIAQPPEDIEEPQPLEIDRQEGSSCKSMTTKTLTRMKRRRRETISQEPVPMSRKLRWLQTRLWKRWANADHLPCLHVNTIRPCFTSS